MEPSGERPQEEGQSSNTGLLAMRHRDVQRGMVHAALTPADSVAETTITPATIDA